LARKRPYLDKEQASLLAISTRHLPLFHFIMAYPVKYGFCHCCLCQSGENEDTSHIVNGPNRIRFLFLPELQDNFQ
jgi:hypothetical protein